MLLGTEAAETIFVPSATGEAQQLLVFALGGNDQVVIPAGITIPVIVDGGAGADNLDASAATGAVTLDGGTGNDVLTGGSGNDVLILHDGNDSGDGRGGNNVFGRGLNIFL